MDRAVRVAKLREAIRMGLKDKEMTIPELLETDLIKPLKYDANQLRARLGTMESVGVVQHKKEGRSTIWSLKGRPVRPLVNGDARISVGYTLKVGGKQITLSQDEARQIWATFNPIFGS